MKQNELQNALQLLSLTDLKLIVWYVRARWLRYKISLLRPIQVLVPATLAQIMVFILAASFAIEKFILLTILGSLVVACLAMIPLMCQPSPAKAHWVRRYE
jgi:hypothetical protein